MYQAFKQYIEPENEKLRKLLTHKQEVNMLAMFSIGELEQEIERRTSKPDVFEIDEDTPDLTTPFQEKNMTDPADSDYGCTNGTCTICFSSGKELDERYL